MLSARHPEALADAARRMADHIERGADVGDVCSTAATRRTHHDERVAVVGANGADLVERLRTFAADGRHAAMATGRRRGGDRRRVAFVFSGQGTQWWGMARRLLQSDAVFREALDACDAALRPRTGWSVVDELEAQEHASRLDQTIVVQPVLFAVQVALAARWRAWGITPGAVVGHSVGEVAAAHVAGALTLDQAVDVITSRARFMQAATGNGTMAAVARPAGELAELVARSDGAISIAAVNAPSATVLAGDTKVMQAVTEDLRAQGVDVRPLPVDYAFHSRQMAPHAEALGTALEGLAPTPGTVRFVSTVTGATTRGTALDAAYWARNVADPVRFSAAIDVLAEDGFDVFLEIGPHPVLGGAITETMAVTEREAVVAASLRRGRPDDESLLLGLAQLHVAGVVVDWKAVFPGRRRTADLPAYPWQRQRHWHDIASREQPTATRGQVGDPLLGRRVRSAAITGAVYESELSVGRPAFLADHRIGDIVVVPATAYLGMAAASFTALTARPVGRMSDIEILEALALDADGAPTTVQVHLQGDGDVRTFSITALGADDTWTRHAAGTVHAGASVPESQPIDHEAIRRATDRTTTGAELYADFDGRDVRFGPAFRNIEQVWTGAADALGALVAPDAGQGSEPFPPAVLDAAIHPLDTLLPGRDTMFLPIALHELRLHGALSGRMWSHVRLRGEDAQTLTVDVTIGAADGSPLAELVGLRVVRTSVTAVAALVGRTAPGAVPVPLHEVRWVPAPPPAATTRGGPWLVITDGAGIGDALAARLRLDGGRCDVILPAADLTRDALDQALAATGARDVVYLRGLDIPALGSASADVVADQERGFGGALLTGAGRRRVGRGGAAVARHTRGPARRPTGRRARAGDAHRAGRRRGCRGCRAGVHRRRPRSDGRHRRRGRRARRRPGGRRRRGARRHPRRFPPRRPAAAGRGRRDGRRWSDAPRRAGAGHARRTAARAAGTTGAGSR